MGYGNLEEGEVPRENYVDDAYQSNTTSIRFKEKRGGYSI
jgi:hypothetical protein